MEKGTSLNLSDILPSQKKGKIFFYFKLRKNYFCDDNEDSDLFPATDKTEASLIIVETWAVKSLCDGNSSKDL